MASVTCSSTLWVTTMMVEIAAHQPAIMQTVGEGMVSAFLDLMKYKGFPSTIVWIPRWCP
eukprot:9455077-Ditylum_brightwellii.AAC.1